MKLARITHDGYCNHDSETWAGALAAALAHANLTMDPRSRQVILPMLIRGEVVWHDQVRLDGRLLDR